MTWLIIIIILIVAIGPVLYLIPSAKDKRLEQLRTSARKQGLTVKLHQLPKLDPSADERVSPSGEIRTPTISCVGYSLPVGIALDSHSSAPGGTSSTDHEKGERLRSGENDSHRPGKKEVEGYAFTLLKEPENPTMMLNTVMPGWSLSNDSDAGFWQAYARHKSTEVTLSQAMEKLPIDTLGIACSERMVTCYWQEKTSADSNVIAQMRMALDEFAADVGAKLANNTARS